MATIEAARGGYVCVKRLFQAWRSVIGEVNTSSQLAALLDSLPLDDVEAVTADAGYLSRRNCDLIEAKGAKPCIKIENIRVIRAFDSRACVDLLLNEELTPKLGTGNITCGLRLEVLSRRLSRGFGHRLASIRTDMQQKEFMSKVHAHNLSILARIN